MNHIYKVIWNALLGLWVVASELAKGKVKAKRSLNRENQNNADKLAAPVQFRPHTLALCMVLSVSMPVAFANDNNKISDQNALINAVNNAASGEVITLTDNITITEQLNVNTLNKNVVIDGGGKFGLIVNNQTANGFVINNGSGTFTLRNMAEIDSANYYGMVQINNGDINLVYDNIDYLGRSQLIFMGTYGQATNSVMTFGNIKNDVVVNDRDQEIGEVNKVAYTGRFHVTHTAGQYSFHNNNAQQNTATMDFGSEADVYIYRTNNQPNLTPQGNYAWQYTFADGAKFELISTQNVLSGTNNNRGMKIGTYDPNAGFGSGASIILTETSPGSGLLGNAIDNFTTNNTGYDIGQTGSADVIFNLGQYTHLATQATAVAATKNAGDAGIYIRNAGIIEAATGIDTIQNGSGKTLIVNQGTITSTKTGVSVSSSAASNITLDNTGGNINATGGTGINVSGEAKLNLIGGIINASQDANAITLSNNAAHTLSDVTLNLNGSGSAIVNSAISGTPNVTMANTTINMANGVALSDLRGLNFAASEKGKNTINVTGTGTGIATDSSSLSAFNPNALQINVKGAGVGIAASGGGADLSNATLNVNVTNNAGVALSIADGVTNNETTIGKQVNLDAADATAIQFTGDKGKTFINNGTVKGNVNFNGDAAHIITNNGTIAGALTAENGNTTLILGQGSQNLGNITLGNGNNNVTINNAANVTSVSAGSGDNKFTLNGLTASDTFLGKIEVGSGNNQLDLVNAKNTLQDTTVLQGFTNISLTNNTDLTLVSKSNITGGDLLLDSSSTLEFDKRYQGEFSVNLMTGSGTDNIDGNIIVNDGANVTLANSKANTFSGGWTINNGGVVNVTNSNQIDNSRVDLDGTLNLNGLQSFNNDLTGIGILNINSATKPFNFTSSVGDQFQGTVALTNTAFTLDDNNTNALKAGTLALNKQSTTTVGDTDRTLNNLVVNGGTVQFNSDAMQSKANGIIKAETLTLQGGVIALEGSGSWENIPNPPAPDLSLFAQDKGDVLMTLITAGKVIGNVNDMTFALNDNQIPSPTSPVYEKIIQNNQNVANAMYHYGLTDNKDDASGLYVKYGLVGLELLTNNADALLLETQGNETLHTVLSGKGGLNIDAGPGSIILANGNNSYSGTTTLSAGTLLLGANKALGNTSNLNISKGAITSLNGFNQTLVTLTNNGTVDLAGGQLTLSEGGSSASVGGLTGKGQLIVNGKDLALSAANNQLQADTLINSGASVTLTESGNLGTSQVTVAKDGQLNLNSAGLVLNNILSGEGRVNTQANTTLSGNSTFTGNHTVGAGSALTISQANNLGADTATVALQGINSALVLNKLAGAIKNSLTGVAESVVRLQAASQVALTGDNSGFGGSYSLSGGSTLTVSEASNLGTRATVSLQTQQDKLNLSGYQGALSNAVKGNGVMALINSTLTLNAEAPLIDNTVGVDIDGNSTVALSGISGFDHQLTGNGALNVSDGGAAFAFGQNTGDRFTGTVNVSNTGIALDDTNTNALKAGTLALNKQGTTTVGDTDRTLNNLVVNGGTVQFNSDAMQSKANGIIKAETLTLQGGVIALEGSGSWENIPNPPAPDLSLFAQDKGDVLMTLITAGKVIGNVNDMTFALNDNQIPSPTSPVYEKIIQNNQDVANAMYHYGLTDNKDDASGLYVKYGLVGLELLTNNADALLLETQGNETLHTVLSGKGGLNIDAGPGSITLANGNNSYSGTTTLSAGTLLLGANKALGNTSNLNISKGAITSLNGFNQTLVTLTNNGTVDLAGGQLTLSEGGSSASVGGLTGKGQLIVNGKDLALSAANNQLQADTLINSGASVTLTESGNLGTSQVTVAKDGQLNLNSAGLVLNNILSGEGRVNTQANTTLSGNSTFIGNHTVGAGSALTISQANNLGADTATVALQGINSALVLNKLAGAIKNSLTGVAESVVRLQAASQVALTGDNSGFGGSYSLSGGSTLTVSKASNLGTRATVSLQTQQDKLNLSDYQGALSNAVKGNGVMALINSTLTLNAEAPLIDNTVGVDIDGNSTVALSGISGFDHQLTGNGALNVSDGGAAFAFGQNTGDRFTGTVNVSNTGIALDDTNTNALKAGTLALNKQSTTTVGDTDRTLNNLVVNGGTVQFNSDAMQSKANGIIKAETLTLQGGVIALEGSGSWENIPNPPAPDLSLFAQDKGDVLMTLITAGKVIGNVNDMTFALNDNQIPSPTSPVYEKIIQNNQNVANAMYHYGLTDNKDDASGLYVKYGLVGLELLTNNADALLLETQGNETLHTVLSGKGGLNIDAGPGSIILANGNNSYSGTTTLSAGTLLLGANKALGNTSNLNISKGAITSLNGFNQTLVTLTNNGTVDLAGGQLTLSEGGSSASVGGLTGKGQLIVNGKDLALSAANNQLQADTLINSGASVTLTESGNLGTSQVTVAKDGQLNLNSAGLVLNNTLSGEGRVNTQANTTLSGNSTFTGNHTVGAGSALTISQANNLGADTATVALQGINSALVLNKLAGAIKNSLTGVAESVVRLQAASQVALTGDNSGFGGSYSLSGGSTLTVSEASNLGTRATVSLQTQQDKLNLSGYQGALSNAVKGNGVMALINSTLTLNAEAPLIDNTVGVDIDGNSTVALSGISGFDHQLTGNGALNVSDGGAAFAFGQNTGDRFTGTVNVSNTGIALDDTNTNALKAGTLALNKQGTTTVGDTDRTLNNLVVNGGTVQFNSDAMQSKANGIIKAETLTLQGGVIALEGSGSWENIPNPPAPDLSLFAQDKGDVLMTLITAGKVIGNVNDMTFALNDNQIPSPTSPVYEKIIQNNQNVANAMYHYGLTDNKDDASGLYVKYGLVGLELLTNNADALLLETQGNETLHTVLSGKGGLNIDAGPGSITLANGNNSYSGTTTLSAGTLLLGANKALGNTSNLNISKGAITSLNGFNQTLVTLTNNGTVDLAGGQLTLSEGGSSASVGGLTGKGQLIVNGKDLALSAANNQLQADTLINSGASVTLTESGNLGTSQVTVAKDGQLNLNSAGLVLNNILSGEGRVNTQANTTLSGNSTFIGNHTVGAGSALTISQANNLGADTATVALQGINSALVLNKLTGAIKNSLTGVAESVVRLQAASQVALTGDNSGFGGSYSLSGGSTLTVSKASNLGTRATVSLQTQQDKLNLSGYQGALSNAVKGNGVMALINSTLTLNAEAPLIDNTVGVDIDGNSTVALSGISGFDHQLTGNGALNVSDGGAAFAFGQNTGARFTGTVDVSNTGIELGGGNTSALTEANLTLSAKGSANVADGIQNIGKLTMNGGTVTFRHILDDHGEFISQGHIVAKNIDVTGGGEVQVALPSNITPSLEGKPLLSLDTGVDIASLMQGKVTGSVHELKLADGNGQLISAEVQSNLFNDGSTTAAATGLFDYGLTTGTQQDGLYVNYGLKEIDLQAKGTDALKLEPLAEHNGLVANNMSAWIRGNGDLAVVGASDDAILSLSNSRNDYSGATLVGKGGLLLKADHVLGNTSELRLSDGTTADIGGYQQALGLLNTEVGSRFNLNGGTVYIKDGGQIDGALIGAGQLTVQSGQLSTSSANRDFTGATTIDSAAAAQLFDVAGLGSGAINNNGKLTLSGAQGSLSNNLSGQGGLLLEDKATVQLTGDNSNYTGTFFVKQGTALTASKAEQLGDGTLDNQGRVTLNVDKAWNMNNVISGSGDLIKQGTATLQIANNTVTAANIIIENGLIQLGSGAISKMAGLTRRAETQSPAELKGNVSIQKNGALGGYGHVIGNVTNAGSLIMPHALTGDRYADFTIKGDYIGQKGSHIFFNTVLAGDDSSTDRLIITGDASGTSTLKISNIGGRGGNTSSGIKIIDIVGESKAKFQLEGRLVAGAYDYKLYQGTGETGSNDGNWYLRTLQPDRPEAGSYIANLAAANTLFNTSLENRSGDTWYTDALTGEKKATSMWLRSSGSHHRFRDNSESLKTQDNRFVVQLGGDVFRFSRNDSDLWRIGLMAGHANSHNSTTTRATGSNSKGTAKGYSVGTYGTWFANEETENGAYVDTWLQYSWFKNEVNGQGLAQEKYNAKGFTTSLESGYTYQLSAGDQYNVYLQPKAQAIWMGVKADTHREASDTVVSGKGNGNVQTRLGVKAFLALSETEKTAKSRTFKPYIETTWVHNTKDFAAEMTHETTGSYTFKQGGASNIGEVKLGLEGDITNRLNMWGNLTQQVGGHGYRDTGVTLGVKYNF